MYHEQDLIVLFQVLEKALWVSSILRLNYGCILLGIIFSKRSNASRFLVFDGSFMNLAKQQSSKIITYTEALQLYKESNLDQFKVNTSTECFNLLFLCVSVISSYYTRCMYFTTFECTLVLPLRVRSRAQCHAADSSDSSMRCSGLRS